MTISPLPGPVIPPAAVRGAGVSRHDVEARSRIVALMLPHAGTAIRSKDDLLEIAEWILLGPDDGSDS